MSGRKVIQLFGSGARSSNSAQPPSNVFAFPDFGGPCVLQCDADSGQVSVEPGTLALAQECLRTIARNLHQGRFPSDKGLELLQKAKVNDLVEPKIWKQFITAIESGKQLAKNVKKGVIRAINVVIDDVNKLIREAARLNPSAPFNKTVREAPDDVPDPIPMAVFDVVMA